MIYLLEYRELYKVGFSENEETLRLRMNSYDTHNAYYKLIGVADGSFEDEQSIHQKCAKYRFKGEWFKKNDYLLYLFNSFNQYDVEDLFKKEERKTTDLYENFLLYVNDEDYNEVVKDEIEYYIKELGLDNCKACNYRRSKMDVRINNVKTIHLTREDMVTEIRNEFPEEGMINKDIKKYLQDKFDKYGIKMTAKATLLEDYIPAFKTKINVDGKRKDGWKLEIHR